MSETKRARDAAPRPVAEASSAKRVRATAASKVCRELFDFDDALSHACAPSLLATVPVCEAQLHQLDAEQRCWADERVVAFDDGANALDGASVATDDDDACVRALSTSIAHNAPSFARLERLIDEQNVCAAYTDESVSLARAERGASVERALGAYIVDEINRCAPYRADDRLPSRLLVALVLVYARDRVRALHHSTLSALICSRMRNGEVEQLLDAWPATQRFTQSLYHAAMRSNNVVVMRALLARRQLPSAKVLEKPLRAAVLAGAFAAPARLVAATFDDVSLRRRIELELDILTLPTSVPLSARYARIARLQARVDNALYDTFVRSYFEHQTLVAAGETKAADTTIIATEAECVNVYET